MSNLAAKLAAVAYKLYFPNGHDIIPTSGEGLLCGFRAVINTMEALYPCVPRPTVDDLLTVFHSPEFVEWAEPFGLDNPNNFTADQVGAVLRLWGIYNSLSLRLGYVVGEEAFLLPHDGDAIIVWIHNDNGEASWGVGHWSGMMPKLVADGLADQWSLLDVPNEAHADGADDEDWKEFLAWDWDSDANEMIFTPLSSGNNPRDLVHSSCMKCSLGRYSRHPP